MGSSESRGNTGAQVSDTGRVDGVGRPPRVPFPFPVGTVVGSLTIIDYRRHRTSKGRSLGFQPVGRCKCGWEGFIHKRYLTPDTWTGRGCPECRRTRTERYRAALPDTAQRTRLLGRLSGIIHRCLNPKHPAYKSYGGRGITVCQEWVDDYSTFLRFFQTLPGWENPDLDLDRINNDGGYEPGNVRLVTRSENCKNKRKVSVMQDRIDALEAEVRDLRSRLGGSEEPVHDLELAGTADCA